jgi:hypothetical protein
MKLDKRAGERQIDICSSVSDPNTGRPNCSLPKKRRKKRKN